MKRQETNEKKREPSVFEDGVWGAIQGEDPHVTRRGFLRVLLVLPWVPGSNLLMTREREGLEDSSLRLYGAGTHLAG